MPEEVLFKFERQMDAAEIGDYLRSVADTIESGEELTLDSGSEQVSLVVPNRPTFEVKAERETNGGTPELSVEFELEWHEGEEAGSGDLSIG